MGNTPVISFEGYEIIEIKLNQFEDVEEIDDKMNFEIEKFIRKDNKHAFLNLRISIMYKEVKSLTVAIQGSFSTDNDLEHEAFDKFISINGVAILLPYIRSTVSVITSLDSDESVLLPTINVHELYKETE